jgi:hypothetical protein
MNRFHDDPILVAFFEYWRGLPRHDGVPDRNNVDPIEMPPVILPNLVLVEFIDDNRDGLLRLTGDEFNQAYGLKTTGRKITDVTEGDYRDYMLGHIDMLVRHRKPLYSESTFRWDRGGIWRTRRLTAPLSNGTPGAVQMWLAAQTFPTEIMRGKPIRELVDDRAEEKNINPTVVDP